MELSLRRIDREAQLTVKVHGSGVPAGGLEAIFQPFYRGAAGRERRSGGTGPGLATAAMTVKAHGGRMEAGNGIQGGQTVFMHLPAAAGEEDQHWEKECHHPPKAGYLLPTLFDKTASRECPSL